MRALEEEYDYLESLGNVYDDGPENVKEKNLEAIRIRHVHALHKKRQLAGFYEPDTDTWSGKYQKYCPWSQFNRGIKNIELTAEESSALYREQLDIRTLIEHEMREEGRVELRLELKKALKSYQQLLQKKMDEQEFMQGNSRESRRLILQSQIDSIHFTISNINKAAELEKNGLYLQARSA
jgi:hypothetical protein